MAFLGNAECAVKSAVYADLRDILRVGLWRFGLRFGLRFAATYDTARLVRAARDDPADHERGRLCAGAAWPVSCRPALAARSTASTLPPQLRVFLV